VELFSSGAAPRAPSSLPTGPSAVGWLLRTASAAAPPRRDLSRASGDPPKNRQRFSLREASTTIDLFAISPPQISSRPSGAGVSTPLSYAISPGFESHIPRWHASRPLWALSAGSSRLSFSFLPSSRTMPYSSPAYHPVGFLIQDRGCSDAPSERLPR
jgi:hypothetical protein